MIGQATEGGGEREAAERQQKCGTNASEEKKEVAGPALGRLSYATSPCFNTTMNNIADFSEHPIRPKRCL
jgi:hypothetical protein